jgi:hypothetical protein
VTITPKEGIDQDKTMPFVLCICKLLINISSNFCERVLIPLMKDSIKQTKNWGQKVGYVTKLSNFSV